MWVAITFAAIALTGTAFMLWFLFALFRENVPSACYWVVLTRREPGRKALEIASYADDDRLPTERNAGEYCFELLESEGDAKECVSSFNALNLRFIHDSVGWRPIHRRVEAFREYGL